MANKVTISDSINTTSSTTAASSTAVKSAYDKAVSLPNELAQYILEATSEISNGGNSSIDIQPLLGTIQHEIGTWWISLDNTVPTGGLPHIGHLCSRATYGDFWTWCESNKTVVTETEWQSYANSHNGCCPYYSNGDGSTTFRTPKYDQSFLKIVASLGNAGDYQSAGLPNITGDFRSRGFVNAENHCVQVPKGVFYTMDTFASDVLAGSGTVAGTFRQYGFDASRSSAIYGNSDTVTPQNFGIIVGVYAVSAVSAPIGTTDVAGILNIVTTIQDSVNSKLDKSGDVATGSIEAPQFIQRLRMDVSSAPSSAIWDNSFIMRDKNNKLAFMIQPAAYTNGQRTFRFITGKNDGSQNVIMNIDQNTDGSGGVLILGKTPVLTVNGVKANASGDVTLGGGVYITATGKSGTSWYTKWSNGYIIQGGEFAGGVSTISLPTAFSTTTYAVVLEHGTGNFYYGATYKNRATSSFGIYTNGYGGSWIACGY